MNNKKRYDQNRVNLNVKNTVSKSLDSIRKEYELNSYNMAIEFLLDLERQLKKINGIKPVKKCKNCEEKEINQEWQSCPYCKEELRKAYRVVIGQSGTKEQKTEHKEQKE